jgi:protein-L-isoaspartate(D-aspartate) O-methyltransferase
MIGKAGTTKYTEYTKRKKTFLVLLPEAGRANNSINGPEVSRESTRPRRKATIMPKVDFDQEREGLIDQELRRLGVTNEAVLQALQAVPREEFVPERLREFAYLNVPLPIGSGQTISQPLIVALMAEALQLDVNDRVLEIGAGSGYAAAVLSRLAREVFSIERVPELAESAAARLRKLGYRNVQVKTGDGTLGWREEGPFEAIVVAAGGPSVPPALFEQLSVGGRLVIPIGADPESQRLVRIIRRGEEVFDEEDMGEVRFVPLIGEAGWQDAEPTSGSIKPSLKMPQVSVPKPPPSLPALIRDAAEPFSSIATVDLNPLLTRIGDAKVVLIGEASHGTSEFYHLRAEMTKSLIEHKGFDFVAVEADWPDAHRIHDFVTHKERDEPYSWEAFARFPTWMWRNQEVLDFIHWLRDFNLHRRPKDRRAGFYGLDLYSLFTSIHRVLEYLDRIDPETAAVARTRYGCLSPWEGDPATYGRAALTGRYRTCEAEVVAMLKDLARRRAETSERDGEDLFDAQWNAQVIADAEQYYRIMYYGSDDSWNHRDTHMFHTLERLLDHHGPEAKAVVWAHNSHLGDARATQFGAHGQLNLGQLCREAFGDACYAIGQGTDHGTVAAASDWDGPLEVKDVRPSHPESYERVMHLAEMERFFLPLTKSRNRLLKEALGKQRLERAIGVIYRPETERHSHYFDANLPEQFDEWIWFDETSAVRALTTEQTREHEPQHPFATFDE